ncbi:glycosyltransferase family 4 protein [Clostridium perfringens]|uniref:glycosyltransferase family 4 protein n=3 Tax=Clostridium perfringens TaxID=1502 RepID=UPI0024BCED4B|nr:glycosyltransferase [Clostridium perfringens]MDU7068039.1 glycosyltransferase [Clostridium perfringens]
MYKHGISYVTGNIAPFRIDLLDDIATKTKSVNLFYYNEIDEHVNPEYVKRRPKNIKYKNISNLSLINQMKEICKNDIVIFDGYSGRDKIKLILMMILNNKDYLISVDGIIYKNKENKIKKLIKHILIANAKFVYSTNKITDDILKSYSKNINIKRHMFTTLDANDMSFIKNIDNYEVRKRLGIPIEKKVVLFVGKFIKTKGIYELLETVDNKYHYVIVGGNREQLELKLSNFPSNVQLIEFLEKREILELMSASDVFVLPTYTDVWGLVVVEAISCGIPVITTNMCNAGLELLNNGTNGFIINKESTYELKNAINAAMLLDRDKVREYDMNLMKDYNINKAADNMLLSINEMLGE